MILQIFLFFCIAFAPTAVCFDFDVHLDQSIITRTQQELGLDAQQLLNFFNDLYVRLGRSKDQFQTLKIPKIIHQIWIGEHVPQEFKEFQESIKKLHPDWRYILWTQHDISRLHLLIDYINKSRNPGEISDLMRYEILYRFGGVYLDMDCECLKSLNDLHYQYDFYIGMQPFDSGLVQLGIGVIGACAAHPFLKACIDGIKEHWNDKDHEYKIPARTGPQFCTKQFYAYVGTSNLRDVVLPIHYFYPLGSNESDLKKDLWLAQGSYMIHHWAKSWLYPSFRREQFKAIKNY